MFSRLTRRGWLGVLVAAAVAIVFAIRPKNISPMWSARLAETHLAAAESAVDKVIAEQIRQIDDFFTEAKKGTRPFANDALSWSSKWRLVVDKAPFTAGDRHQKLLRSLFEEHVFKAEHLEAAVKQVIQQFNAEMRSIENKMLVDLRADVARFPAEFPAARWSDDQWHKGFNLALERAAAAAGSELTADVARELASMIAGEVLGQAATRMAVSAGIVGAGAASSWATFGVGLVVGIIVDQIVSWVWNRLADPQGKLAADLETKLDEIHRLIVDGSAEAEGLRPRLKRMAKERADVRRTAVLDLLHSDEGDSR